MTFVPKYIIVSELGWVSTLQGIIVPELFNAFACFLFRQFYLNFPQELEDAGRVDGLGYFGFNAPTKAYIEVISFDGLLKAANERNRAFFDKLGLPTA